MLWFDEKSISTVLIWALKDGWIENWKQIISLDEKSWIRLQFNEWSNGKINFQVNNSDIETKGFAHFRFKYLIFELLAMALSEETTYF